MNMYNRTLQLFKQHLIVILSEAFSPSPHPVPDCCASFFEAEQEESIWGELAEELRQSGEAGCVAKLLSRHVALTVTAAA